MFYYVIEGLSEKYGAGRKSALASGGTVPAGAHARRDDD
jgi:hypothetical protein